MRLRPPFELEQTQPGDLAPTADEAWRALLRTLIRDGMIVAPRSQNTVEVLHHVSLSVDLNHPVIVCPERKLNYRFMAAEALWIAAGRDDLEPLVAVNPRMAQFSDDGKTLAGAYGPRIRPQVPYVLECLLKDRDTRQAALTIWRPGQGPSKDVPCTIAMVFSIRDHRLYQHAFMRSSDAWLGIPYDVFSFSVLAMELACRYNWRKWVSRQTDECIGLGHLTITCTSSHLYERDYPAAVAVLTSELPQHIPVVDPELINKGLWDELKSRIESCQQRQPGAEPRYPL